jgi:hypothetical protein
MGPTELLDVSGCLYQLLLISAHMPAVTLCATKCMLCTLKFTLCTVQITLCTVKFKTRGGWGVGELWFVTQPVQLAQDGTTQRGQRL